MKRTSSVWVVDLVQLRLLLVLKNVHYLEEATLNCNFQGTPVIFPQHIRVNFPTRSDQKWVTFC